MTTGSPPHPDRHRLLAEELDRGARTYASVMAENRPEIVNVTSFEDARQAVHAYREGRDILLQLSGATPDLKRRLLDFASGVALGTGGRLDRSEAGSYLLSHPAG